MLTKLKFRLHRLAYRWRTRYRYRLRRLACRFLLGHRWFPDGSWSWVGKTCRRCNLSVVERRAKVVR